MESNFDQKNPQSFASQTINVQQANKRLSYLLILEENMEDEGKTLPLRDQNQLKGLQSFLTRFQKDPFNGVKGICRKEDNIYYYVNFKRTQTSKIEIPQSQKLYPFPTVRISGLGSVIKAYNEYIIKELVDDKNMNIISRIGQLSNLKSAGILMVIIKANSRDLKCELEIKKTMNKFQDLISASDLTCQFLIEVETHSLKYHQKAKEYTEKKNYKSALINLTYVGKQTSQIIQKCNLVLKHCEQIKNNLSETDQKICSENSDTSEEKEKIIKKANALKNKNQQAKLQISKLEEQIQSSQKQLDKTVQDLKIRQKYIKTQIQQKKGKIIDARDMPQDEVYTVTRHRYKWFLFLTWAQQSYSYTYTDTSKKDAVIEQNKRFQDEKVELMKKDSQLFKKMMAQSQNVQKKKYELRQKMIKQKKKQITYVNQFIESRKEGKELDSALLCIRVCTQNIEMIQTIFRKLQQFWKTIEQRTKDLDQNIKNREQFKADQIGMSEHIELYNTVCQSNLNWLALAKFTVDGSKHIRETNQEITKQILQLPIGNKSIQHANRLYEIWRKDMEQKNNTKA